MRSKWINIAIIKQRIMIQQQENMPIQKNMEKLQNILDIFYDKPTETLFLDRLQNWVQVLQHIDTSQLQTLIIQNCNMRKSKYMKIFSKMNWSNLKFLKLYNHQMKIQAIQILLNSEWPSLQILRLTGPLQFGGRLNSQQVARILEKQIKRIKYIMLDRNNINRLIIQNNPTLQRLNLNENNIGNSGIKLFIKSNLPCLKILQMQSCLIGSEGCKYLTKNNWHQLNTFKIRFNKIKLDGILHIYLSNWTMLLQFLYSNHFFTNNIDNKLTYFLIISHRLQIKILQNR